MAGGSQEIKTFYFVSWEIFAFKYTCKILLKWFLKCMQIISTCMLNELL